MATPIRFDSGVTPQIDTNAYAKAALMRQDALQQIAKPLGTALDAVRDNNTTSILQRIQQVRSDADWQNPETQSQIEQLRSGAAFGSYDKTAVNNAMEAAPTEILKRMNADTSASDFGLQAQFGRNVIGGQLDQAKTTAGLFSNPNNILSADSYLNKQATDAVESRWKGANAASVELQNLGKHPDQDIKRAQVLATASAAEAKSKDEKSTKFAGLNSKIAENMGVIANLRQEIDTAAKTLVRDPQSGNYVENPAVAAKRAQLAQLEQTNSQLSVQIEQLRSANTAKAAYSLQRGIGAAPVVGRNVALSKEQTGNMDITYKALTQGGISPHNAALLIGEIGREGSFLNKSIHGSHTDAGNGKSNSGIISYNDPKRKKGFEDYMAKNGFMMNGKLVASPAATAAQASYVLEDMKTNYPTVYQAMTSGDLTPEQADEYLGKQFIGWDQSNKSGATGSAYQNLADFTLAAQKRYLNEDGTLNQAGIDNQQIARPTSGIGQGITGVDLPADYGKTSVTSKPLTLPANMRPKAGEIAPLKMSSSMLAEVRNTAKALEQDAHRSYESSQAKSNAGAANYEFYRDYEKSGSKVIFTDAYDKANLVNVMVRHPLYKQRKKLGIPDSVFQEAADETAKYYEQEDGFLTTLKPKAIAPVAFDYLEKAVNKHVNVLHTEINSKVQGMAEKMSMESNGDLTAVPYFSRVLSDQGMFIDIKDEGKLKKYRQEGIDAVNRMGAKAQEAKQPTTVVPTPKPAVKTPAKPAAVNNNARPAVGTLFDPKTLATSKNADAWRKELAKRQN